MLSNHVNEPESCSISNVSYSVHTQPTVVATSDEAATVHLHIDQWLSTICDMRASSNCSLSSSELDEIEQHISSGISLPLLEPPPGIQFANTTTVNDHHQLVADRINEYISIGAVRVLPVDSPVPSIVQPLHVIIKDGKKPRLVIDLSRNLNQLLPHEPFHYTSVNDAVLLSSSGCFYSKLDISNCFLSFPLHPSCYQYFTFLFADQYYQFIRLPFGLSSAPRICTLLLSVIQFKLEQYQLRLVRYLDDFLFISSSPESASEHLSTAIRVCGEFGLVVNRKKTEGPSQQMQFLGIQLDSVACTLSITQQRISDLNELLIEFIAAPSSSVIRVKHVLSFIGKLSFISQVLPSARPFMRRLLDAVKGKRKQQRCRLPTEFRLDCAVWLRRINDWNGLLSWSIHTQPQFVIVSDASIDGFGFYLADFPRSTSFDRIPFALLPGCAVSGQWHPSMSHLLSYRSIAYLELFSVVYALTLLSPALHNQSVLILTDNASNVPVLRKHRTRSATLIQLLRALSDLSSAFVFSCTARHISGDSNVLADFLSRPQLHKHQHVDTWRSFDQSHSFSLSHVTTVCSSSLHLPAPTVPLTPAVLLNLSVPLSYLPSLTSSNPCLFVPAPRSHMHLISEPSSSSATPSLSIRCSP